MVKRESLPVKTGGGIVKRGPLPIKKPVKTKRLKAKTGLSVPDISALRFAHHAGITYQTPNEIALLSLFHMDKEKGTAIYSILVPTDVVFVSKELEEPCSVELSITNTHQDFLWQTFASALEYEDEINIVVFVDFLSTQYMLENGFHGDLIQAIQYRKRTKQWHYVIGHRIWHPNDGEERVVRGLTKNPLDVLNKEIFTDVENR